MSLNNHFIYHITVDDDWEALKQALIRHPDIILFFDTKYIICEEQVVSAIFRANRAMERGNNLAKKIEIEVMVHLAGEHQINTALKLFNVNHTTKTILLIQNKDHSLIAKSIKGWPIFDVSAEILKALKLTSDAPCKEIISKSARMSLDYE